jgi:hypothetical protein
VPSPPASPEINIRSPRYYIARTASTCWHCGSPTALVAIAVPPGHETLDVDDEAPVGETHAAATWSVADHDAFLFYIGFLPAAVQERINQYQPAYRPHDPDAVATPVPVAVPAASAGFGSHWANHCEKCGCQLDDHELFCEPDGAFLPTSASAAAAIRLVLVDEPFETSAAGYSYEPPFFDAMIRG